MEFTVKLFHIEAAEIKQKSQLFKSYFLLFHSFLGLLLTTCGNYLSCLWIKKHVVNLYLRWMKVQGLIISLDRNFHTKILSAPLPNEKTFIDLLTYVFINWMTLQKLGTRRAKINNMT